MRNNLVFILSFLLISYSFGQSLVTEEETQRAAVKYARLFLNYDDMSQANAVSMKSYTENSHVTSCSWNCAVRRLPASPFTTCRGGW